MQVSTSGFSCAVAALFALGACDAARGCSARREANVHRPSAAAGESSVSVPEPTEPVARVRCTADPSFPPSIAIPEASGAAEIELSTGIRELAVVSDSGHDGALALVPLARADGGAPPGAPRFVTLALGRGASDDIEGLAVRNRALYTLTSSGAVRRFVPDARGGLMPDGGAYAIGAPPYSCDLGKVNCGKNWEGLCLRGASIAARCIGYAASKADDALYCVVESAGKLAIDTVKPPLKLALPAQSLSDCAFGAEGGPAERVLVVTTNVHGGSRSYVVDESSGALERIDVSGHVTNEAIAIDRTGALYQFMDDNRSPSASSRALCEAW